MQWVEPRVSELDTSKAVSWVKLTWASSRQWVELSRVSLTVELSDVSWHHPPVPSELLARDSILEYTELRSEWLCRVVGKCSTWVRCNLLRPAFMHALGLHAVLGRKNSKQCRNVTWLCESCCQSWCMSEWRGETAQLHRLWGTVSCVQSQHKTSLRKLSACLRKAAPARVSKRNGFYIRKEQSSRTRKATNAVQRVLPVAISAYMTSFHADAKTHPQKSPSTAALPRKEQPNGPVGWPAVQARFLSARCSVCVLRKLPRKEPPTRVNPNLWLTANTCHAKSSRLVPKLAATSKLVSKMRHVCWNIPDKSHALNATQFQRSVYPQHLSENK